MMVVLLWLNTERPIKDGKRQVSDISEMIMAYRRTGGTPHLDGQYTVFGEVIEGLDVVERIMKVFTDDYDRPVDDVRIIRATCQ